MNLGFVLFDYFPFGGLQRDCLKIARICAGRGHAVTLFTRSWQGARPEGLQVVELGRRGFTNTSRNRHFIKSLEKQLPERRFDRVVGFNKVPGLDVYYGADPCYAAKIQRLKPRWYRWLPRPRFLLQLEASVFAEGSSTQILLLTSREIPLYQKFYRTESGRFHVLPPGITRRDFDAAERRDVRARIRKEHGWESDDLLVLFIGSGFRIKGLDRAITAIAGLPPTMRSRTQLVVIGADKPAKYLRQAKTAGVADRIHFLGGRHDVPDWLLAGDVLLHPAYSESAGMVLLEALAAGLPVLTTDVCGYAPHVAKAEAGVVLSSPFVQQSCNEALGKMLSLGRAGQWRENGLAYAAREDLTSCHGRAAEVIEQSVRTV